MPLIATSNETGPRPLPSPGTHVARCVSVIDMGTHTGEYAGKAIRRHKVRLTWELPCETAVFRAENGEQPFVVSKLYTLSLHEKSALRHDLESWRSRQFTEEELAGFDIRKLLNTPCLLAIVHQEKDARTFANIVSVSQLAKGLECPQAYNPLVHYEIEQGRDGVYELFPEWLRNKIAECEEWEVTTADQDERPGEEKDEIPF